MFVVYKTKEIFFIPIIIVPVYGVRVDRSTRPPYINASGLYQNTSSTWTRYRTNEATLEELHAE